MAEYTAIILAAGKGQRMKSRLPKVLHPVCGQPMVVHVAQCVRDAGAKRVVMVVGIGAEEVRKALGLQASFVEQSEQRGTGHALLQAKDAAGKGNVLVLNGDVPLVRPLTLQAMMRLHEDSRAVITLLTGTVSSTHGLGRIVRDATGRVCGIVEEAEATEEQRRITEVNVGAYCFNADWLWPHLAEIAPGKRGEIYLTDLLAIASRSGERVEALRCADPTEAMSVNTRIELAAVDEVMRQRIRERWMLAGVTLIDPKTIYIDAEARIGQDTVILPQTTIAGRTEIGDECRIGPQSIVRDSRIGRGCKVEASMVEGSTLEDHVDVGPYSHLRPECYVEEGTHIGNFVEIKKSRLGKAAKAGHVSYIGDATIGANVNIGAGTITCNFDGTRKNPTIIEEDAFIGCDSMLVAPVRVGARAVTGAGAVVTRDVPADTTVVGVPARPLAPKKDAPSPSTP